MVSSKNEKEVTALEISQKLMQQQITKLEGLKNQLMRQSKSTSNEDSPLLKEQIEKEIIFSRYLDHGASRSINAKDMSNKLVEFNNNMILSQTDNYNRSFYTPLNKDTTYGSLLNESHMNTETETFRGLEPKDKLSNYLDKKIILQNMGTRIEKMRRKKELHNVRLMQKLGMTHDGSMTTFSKVKSKKKIHKAAQSVLSQHGPSISKEDTTARGSNLENIIA